MSFDNGWRGPDIVADNLVTYLDAGSPNSYVVNYGTTWRDISGNSNNGTLINTPTFSSDNRGIFSFNGTNQYVSAGSPNLQTTWTLEIWAYMNSDVAFGLFGQGIGGTNQGLHIYYTNGARGMVFAMWNNDNDYANNYRPLTGIWYHWVFTYNSSTFAKQFYANGVLQTPGSSVQNIYQGSGQFNIGATFSIAEKFANGRIGGVKRYSSILSAQEIAQNYNAQKSRFGL